MSCAVFAEKETGAAASRTRIASSSLRIGAPNDSFEQESDRIADEVMAGGTKLDWSFSRMSIDPPLQRKCSCGGSGGSEGQCEECKEKEQKTLQRKAADAVESDVAPPIVHDVLRSPGEPLDAPIRAYFEPRFGHDFSKVRVHADRRAADSARAVNALAYTVGRDIVFANRPPVPGTAEGARILAHELTHVLQQSGGSDGRAGLRVGSIDSPFEREADQAANALISKQPSAPPVHAETPALQRQLAQTPAQTPAQAPAQANWGSKKWPGDEPEWNAVYQLAIQGLAGGKLKPEKIADLAAGIADRSMLLCHRHGKQSKCAVAAASDQESKSTLDWVLAWGVGSAHLWGETFRSAIQSTSSGVDGPISSQAAVQRAGDIADQAVRGMLGDALWKTYMNCKIPDVSSSPAPPPKAAASGGH